MYSEAPFISLPVSQRGQVHKTCAADASRISYHNFPFDREDRIPLFPQAQYDSNDNNWNTSGTLGPTDEKKRQTRFVRMIMTHRRGPASRTLSRILIIFASRIPWTWTTQWRIYGNEAKQMVGKMDRWNSGYLWRRWDLQLSRGQTLWIWIFGFLGIIVTFLFWFYLFFIGILRYQFWFLSNKYSERKILF